MERIILPTCYEELRGKSKDLSIEEMIHTLTRYNLREKEKGLTDEQKEIRTMLRRVLQLHIEQLEKSGNIIPEAPAHSNWSYCCSDFIDDPFVSDAYRILKNLDSKDFFAYCKKDGLDPQVFLN